MTDPAVQRINVSRCWRRAAVLSIITIVLIITVWVMTLSPTFRECVHNHKLDTRYNLYKDNENLFNIMKNKGISYSSCAVHIIDLHQGTLAAFFAICLIGVGYGQWRTYGAQIRVTTALERSYVFPAYKKLGGDGEDVFWVQYNMRNIGKTPAIIKECRVCFCKSDIANTKPIYDSGERQKFNWAIAGNDSGETKKFVSEYAGHQFFYVQILYVDVFGKTQYSRSASEWRPEGFGDEGQAREAGGEPYNSWS